MPVSFSLKMFYFLLVIHNSLVCVYYVFIYRCVFTYMLVPVCMYVEANTFHSFLNHFPPKFSKKRSVTEVKVCWLSYTDYPAKFTYTFISIQCWYFKQVSVYIVVF